MKSYLKLKKTLYISMTLLGLYLILASSFGGWHIQGEAARLSAFISTAVGLVLMLFGLTTYILRGDEDIWR